MMKSNGAKQFGNKQWPHAPEALLRGRLVYTVKFYGDQEVAEAKGTEPIKEAVRKMKFNKQLRKSEGQKTTPKVELHINVDGLSIQDPKTKVQQFKFPLHHISYCADDKSEKKLFTFIAKDGATGRHHCFVLGSEKNAEEITLTIGQAFDLAYKRFLERQNNQDDKQRQFFLLQQQVTQLQAENKKLKERVAELEAEKQYASVLSGGTTAATSSTPTVSQPATAAPPKQSDNGTALTAQSSEPPLLPTSDLGSALFDDIFTNSKPFPGSGVGATRHETGGGTAPPIPVRLAPPPATVRPHSNGAGGSAASEPQLISAATDSTTAAASGAATTSTGASSNKVDAFGMPNFGTNELMEFEEMRSGFSRGLSIGVEDFDVSTLDPLNN